jgi:hypothetical protein
MPGCGKSKDVFHGGSATHRPPSPATGAWLWWSGCGSRIPRRSGSTPRTRQPCCPRTGRRCPDRLQHRIRQWRRGWSRLPPAVRLSSGFHRSRDRLYRKRNRPRGLARGRESELKVGAPGGTRTHDLQVRNLALYPLSYGRTPLFSKLNDLAEREGFEPSRQVTPPGGLANRCTRPLCDLSRATAAGILAWWTPDAARVPQGLTRNRRSGAGR